MTMYAVVFYRENLIKIIGVFEDKEEAIRVMVKHLVNYLGYETYEDLAEDEPPFAVHIKDCIGADVGVVVTVEGARSCHQVVPLPVKQTL